MLIDEITTDEEFDHLRPEWDALVPGLDVPAPFQSWEWNRIWWKHFGSAHRLRILAFRDGGGLVGIAQFHERRFGPSYLGRTLIAPLGWEDPRRRQGMTEQNELIFPSPDKPRLLSALSEWLDRHRWTLAMLPGMQVPTSLPEGLSNRLVLVGKPNSFYGRTLPASYTDFVRGLNKSMRDNVKYYPKLLERTGHRVALHVSDTSAVVHGALDVFFGLHRARANVTSTVKHRDKFAEKDRRAFLQDVAPRLADLGQLKIGLLGVDDAIVAAQIWLETGDTMFMYYTGWDPAWSKYSVQLVATLECLKLGIERGIRHVEFLRGGAEGNDQRNERWDTSRRVRVNVTLARMPAVTKVLLRSPRVRQQFRLAGTTVGGEALNLIPPP